MDANLNGQTLGPYRVIEQIGKGGMATVFKAYEPSLDRYVAIKILPEYFAHYPEFVTRFEREAKAVAKLDHPNIVPIFGYGQDQGFMYLVMRYVPAGTLREMLGQPLHLSVVGDILRQVGGALHYAHQQGIIHRDVKPSNVLMADQKWALLTDFGLAKMVESSSQLTKSGVGVGTPAYMSPEQGQGMKVDHRTDIYSLGVMLYEMTTGHIPYDAETPMAIVLKHISAPLPLPRVVNPNLPEGVERVILKAMAKDPEDRFSNVDEMVKAFDKALAETPASEIPTRLGEAAVQVEKTPQRVAQETLAQPATLAQPGAKTVPDLEQPPAQPRVRKSFPVWAWVLLGIILLGVIAGGVGLALRVRNLAATEQVPVAGLGTKTQAAVIQPNSTPVPPTRTPLPLEPTKSPPTKAPAEGFIDSGQRLGDFTAEAIHLADIDGDGDLDAIVADGNVISIWMNGGTAQFKPGKPVGPDEPVVDAGVGDLDRDGDQDIFACNPLSDRGNMVWLNQGKGIFLATGQLLTGFSCRAVALGDLDGDGDLDAFTANAHGTQGAGVPDSVWLNEGGGTFRDSGQRLGSFPSVGVALGDLDRDGDLDAFVAVDDEKGLIGAKVYFNDGRSGFTDSGQNLGNLRNMDVALADFDMDGDLDAVMANCCNQGNTLWLNDGKGRFTDSGRSVGTGDASGGLAVGDLDGNGTVDVFVGNFINYDKADQPGAPEEVWLNDGKANFKRTDQNLGESKTGDVALGDLDGDGDLDAFVANLAADEVWLNQWNTKPKFKVCLLTDVGGVGDRSFNQSSWMGLEEAGKLLGIQPLFLEPKTPGDYEKDLHALLEQGCDLVLSSGWLLGDATWTVAKEKPERKFAIIDFTYEQTLPNLRTSVFAIDQASFLAGYLAAGMTKTGKVGTYGGVQIPPVVAFMDGFALGVLQYNQAHGTQVGVLGWDPKAQKGLFTGNFTSKEDGRKASEDLLAQGADILFPVAGPQGIGTLELVGERGSGLVIGVDTDWSVFFQDRQDIILASVVKNIGDFVIETVKMTRDGRFQGGSYLGTLENGGVGLALSPAWREKVPAKLKLELEKLALMIAEGRVKTRP